MLPNFLKHAKMEAALWVASIFFVCQSNRLPCVKGGGMA